MSSTRSKRLSADQRSALLDVERIHEEYIDARRRLRKEVEARFEADLLTIRVRESMAANKAIQLGVAKTTVGRAFGTSDFNTINERLALTAEEFAAADVSEIEDRVLEYEAGWFRAVIRRGKTLLGQFDGPMVFYAKLDDGKLVLDDDRETGTFDGTTDLGKALSKDPLAREKFMAGVREWMTEGISNAG